MFALVDGNNFFVSCERVFNPYWNDRPILVLSNNDGCVIARSNEVKNWELRWELQLSKYWMKFKSMELAFAPVIKICMGICLAV